MPPPELAPELELGPDSGPAAGPDSKDFSSSPEAERRTPCAPPLRGLDRDGRRSGSSAGRCRAGSSPWCGVRGLRPPWVRSCRGLCWDGRRAELRLLDSCRRLVPSRGGEPTLVPSSPSRGALCRDLDRDRCAPRQPPSRSSCPRPRDGPRFSPTVTRRSGPSPRLRASSCGRSPSWTVLRLRCCCLCLGDGSGGPGCPTCRRAGPGPSPGVERRLSSSLGRDCGRRPPLLLDRRRSWPGPPPPLLLLRLRRLAGRSPASPRGRLRPPLLSWESGRPLPGSADPDRRRWPAGLDLDLDRPCGISFPTPGLRHFSAQWGSRLRSVLSQWVQVEDRQAHDGTLLDNRTRLVVRLVGG